nr:hypothetical protein [Tanacetum cinerariifolium]
MESLRELILERAKHKREYDSRRNERHMQLKERKIDSSKVLDADLVVTEISRTESEKHDTNTRSRNDTHAEDAYIKPVNDKELMVEVHLTAQNNVLANEQQHYVQSEPIYDIYLLEKVDNNITPDSTNMSHIGREIDQNAKKSLKDGQHGQILNKTSNKSMIKKEIEVLETINIELEQSVDKLLAENEKLYKENEHLKQTYKDLYDSIKKTRVQTKDLNDSLIAQVNSKTVKNADLKAQIQEKVFANVTLKNELKKLKGNSVDIKFAKPSILVEFLILLVLGGFQLERDSPLAQQMLAVNPQMVQMKISLTHMNENKFSMSVQDTDMSLIAYEDADHVGCQDTRRSTSGSAQFLGDKLVSWSSKKHKSTDISNYGFQFNKIPLYCDNKSAIALCCNNLQHSRAKHIDVRYYFIKEQAKNEIVELYFILRSNDDELNYNIMRMYQQRMVKLKGKGKGRV